MVRPGCRVGFGNGTKTPISDADPLLTLSAADLSDAYASGRLSPVEVATAALDRAEAIQPRFNAFTRIDRPFAMAAARESEARWLSGTPKSAVDGVPTTIKDIVWVEGWPIRYGSPSTGEVACASDAPAVARLRAAGVTILGLTTTPEFGWKALTDGPLSGITRNPWNPAMTPGGSSGGAAVAAATGAGVFHLGTDGGGSIRVPSSFTGLVGLKPSYGRVPAYPASAFGTVAHLGPMTRRVDDAVAMLDAMSGRDPQDWLQGPFRLPPLDREPRGFAGAKVGVWSRPPCGAVDPEIAARFAAVVDDLRGLGAEVVPIDLPEGDHLATFTVLWSCGAATRAAALTPDARAHLDPGLREVVAAGERHGCGALRRSHGGPCRLRPSDGCTAGPVRHPGLARHRHPGVRGRARGPARQRHGALVRVGRLQLPDQPVPAAGGLRTLRHDGIGPADRAADRRAPRRGRARARLRQSLRDRLSVLLPVRTRATS